MPQGAPGRQDDPGETAAAEPRPCRDPAEAGNRGQPPHHIGEEQAGGEGEGQNRTWAQAAGLCCLVQRR